MQMINNIVLLAVVKTIDLLNTFLINNDFVYLLPSIVYTFFISRNSLGYFILMFSNFLINYCLYTLKQYICKSNLKIVLLSIKICILIMVVYILNDEGFMFILGLDFGLFYSNINTTIDENKTIDELIYGRCCFYTMICIFICLFVDLYLNLMVILMMLLFMYLITSSLSHISTFVEQ
jgi:hypothetical protein